jgi:uncharacterized protein YejL (UPF0352 family)
MEKFKFLLILSNIMMDDKLKLVIQTELIPYVNNKKSISHLSLIELSNSIKGKSDKTVEKILNAMVNYLEENGYSWVILDRGADLWCGWIYK